INEIEEEYRSGKMLTGELKEILIEKLNSFLEEHRRKREEARDLVHTFKYDGKLAKEMWEKIHE
ncbi:tryptophan--tRNA ligase, partial [Acidianus sp. DSM 29099]|nr:tryptophan--tRNA ligase [Acidianus sp. RZ1]